MDPDRDVSHYIQDEWTSGQGFPGGPVYAIAQTPDGYLWIGAEKGLVRFDGVEFRLVHPTLPGRPAIGAVLGLTTDVEGSLWIRVSGLALLRYRNGEFTAMSGSPVQPEALVTAMIRGLDGRLLSSSIDGDTIAERGGRFETRASPAGMPRSVVISIAETSSGDVWLGTRDAGLVSIRGGHLSHIVNGLPDRKVNSLLRGDDRELWVGTDKGVVRWNGTEITTTGVPAALAGVQALSMVRDRGSNIWIGTASGGLVRVNGRGASVLGARNERPRGAVTALFEDRDGNLWVGSARGLERVRDSAFATYSTSQGLPSDSQGPVHVDSDGRAWFAPSEGGLYWLRDGQIGRITAAGLGSDVVYSIAGAKRDVWIGRQRGGLTHLRESGGAWRATTYTQAQGLAQNSVYAVHESRDGTVWAGTLSGGVSRLEGGRFTAYTTADGLASNTVASIAEGVDGTMWFGTPNGVSAFANGRWTSYSEKDGLPSSDVSCLSVDSAGVVWIGTASGLAFVGAGRDSGSTQESRGPSGTDHRHRGGCAGLDLDRHLESRRAGVPRRTGAG